MLLLVIVTESFLLLYHVWRIERYERKIDEHIMKMDEHLKKLKKSNCMDHHDLLPNPLQPPPQTSPKFLNTFKIKSNGKRTRAK